MLVCACMGRMRTWSRTQILPSRQHNKMHFRQGMHLVEMPMFGLLSIDEVQPAAHMSQLHMSVAHIVQKAHCKGVQNQPFWI